MGRIVPAVSRALDILELFLTDDSATLGAPDIARRLELPRTTVHELVHTLLARGYLAPAAGESGRLQLGPRLHQLGGRYAERLDLAAEARRSARWAAEQCGETVHVALLEGAEVVYIAKVDSTHAVRMASAVGRRLPAHCTGVGKALLAALDEAELAALYPDGRPLSAMTSHTVTEPARLRAELAEVRKTGVATEYCESNPDVACVAAQVRDAEGQVTAALSISVPVLRWSDARAAELAEIAAAGAGDMSARLGWGGGQLH
ncbi:IclR family transcriptional regulator [Allostreptomyces psammosilenae]|uniref:DNA-binding IclR family transcriptional regulator n=1 Tax=Allostreptomyces psammosilenae TaxID=1892865 RepID=A0A852ZY83_9ACTN|nr:IclR family transcriptional regulator [Allostreptomyces psammosilenae]NYI07296.1 DNA-binding IclR family transcriptional regulator [Allostreptomyces psammosilenae]